MKVFASLSVRVSVCVFAVCFFKNYKKLLVLVDTEKSTGGFQMIFKVVFDRRS